MLLHTPWGGESLLRSSGLTRVALFMVGEVARAVAAVDLLEARIGLSQTRSLKTFRGLSVFRRPDLFADAR